MNLSPEAYYALILVTVMLFGVFVILNDINTK